MSVDDGIRMVNGHVVERSTYGGPSIPYDSRIADWKKEAGDIPPYTCPAIDDVIRDIKTSKEYCLMAGRALTMQEAVNLAEKAAVDLAGNVERMENLRESNENLRNIGWFWYEKCCDLMIEVCELKKLKEKESLCR